MNMKFKNWKCEVLVNKYTNGNTAILLNDSDDGEPIATATVNLGEKLPKDLAYIKTIVRIMVC